MLHLYCLRCDRLTRHAENQHHSGERLPQCENCGTWKPTPMRPVRPARRKRLKINPSPRRGIAAAKRLGEAFTGHPYNRVLKVRQKPATGPRVAIGPVTGIMYLAKRDGKVEQYLHRFAARSRPLLATLSDGTRLELLGGAFRFTDRGIVDTRVAVRKRNRRH